MAEGARGGNFLADIIEADLAAGRNGGRVVTRFPPEPNGFLHIGHAKSILLNFGLARTYGGEAHLRFDDTNPTAEDSAYVEAIQRDVRWLGCDWGDHLHFASDVFDRMYACAERLVRDGKAYVDSQPVEAIREGRGSFERPGTPSPFRERLPEENLALLERMRAGELPDGACVLRARIDMAHPNVLLRDPLLYRIRHARHHRTGDLWCIYPMYDFAHPLEDAFEGITHSICTLEFESNRELYDWVLDNTGPWDPRPRQYEFARLALGYTVLSKRKLLQLVAEKRVSGWDDPRMPTLAGLRRRGVTPEALREFADLIGVAKNNSVVDIGKLEFAVRGDLEKRAPRAMAVLRPLPLIVESWPEGREVELALPWWPGEPGRGTRAVPFGRELLVERDDFALEPPPGWKRLAPGREVRLAGAYVVRCVGVERGAAGEVTAVRCTHEAGSAGEGGPRGLGAVHWVHAHRSTAVTVRLYDRLFRVERPDAEEDFLQALDPESLTVIGGARVEPALAEAAAGSHWQFLRQGYFFADPEDSRPGAPVFNRTLALKDPWSAKAVARSASTAVLTTGIAPGGHARSSTAESAAWTTGRPLEPHAPSSAAVSAALSTAPTTEPVTKAAPSPRPESLARLTRYRDELELSASEAELLGADEELSRFFEAALPSYPHPKPLARWLANDLLGLAKGVPLASLPLGAPAFGKFVALVESGRVTAASAKVLLAALVQRGGDPEALMAELGLARQEDPAALLAAVERALSAHAREAERYRAGEVKLFGVLLGAVMREAQGAADAASARRALEERLR